MALSIRQVAGARLRDLRGHTMPNNTPAAPLIRWLTRTWQADYIERIECTRETADSYWTIPTNMYGKPVVGQKDRRHLKGGELHNSWEEAHAHLIRRANEAVEIEHSRVARLKQVAATVRAMRKPDNT